MFFAVNARGDTRKLMRKNKFLSIDEGDILRQKRLRKKCVSDQRKNGVNRGNEKREPAKDCG